MKTRVKVIFPANKPDEPSRPYVGHNVEKRSQVVISKLETQLPDMDFTSAIYRSPDEAEQAYQRERAEHSSPYDGYLVYMTAPWTGIPEFYAQNAHPLIVADELYSRSGGFLGVQAQVRPISC